jgi:hypothetical protein
MKPGTNLEQNLEISGTKGVAIRYPPGPHPLSWVLPALQNTGVGAARAVSRDIFRNGPENGKMAVFVCFLKLFHGIFHDFQRVIVDAGKF